MSEDLEIREPITQDAWDQRLAQAKEFQRLNTDCVICSGTGGWPEILTKGFVACRSCHGTGQEKSYEM